MQPREDEPEREGCDRCRWAEWETAVWTITVVVALILLMVVFANLSDPSDVCGGRGNPCPAATTSTTP